MVSPMLSVTLIPFLAAMFLAINMGGSGISPSFSAAFGSKVIKKDLVPGLFGIFVFLGAIVAGEKVVLTVSRGIIPSNLMGLILTTIILISVSIALLLANLLKIPQSTSQATIFALIGPAVYFNVLDARELFFEIIPTWLIVPALSLVITLLIGKLIYYPLKKKGFLGAGKFLKGPLLKIIVISVSCYVAFAIGSNNVANAAGPIVSMLLNELNIDANGVNSLIIMIVSVLIVAPCFAIGSSLLGSKVIETTGKEIIEFGPLGATLVSLVTATLLLFTSIVKGIPTSLVQTNTMAIIGLGICKTGRKGVFNHNSVKKLFIMWIISPLIALLLSFFLTALASRGGLL